MTAFVLQGQICMMYVCITRHTSMYMHTVMEHIVNRLCGHNYEYGTTDINFLYFICAISRIIANRSGDMVRKHEACAVRTPVSQSRLN